MNEEIISILNDMQFEGYAGDGVVTVTINGNFKVTSVDIQDIDFEEDEIYLLEEYVAVAMNEALEKVKYAREKVFEETK